MTLGRFLLGIPLLLVAVIPVVLAAGRLRSLLFPDWDGLEARLVEAVVALAAVTVTAEALGTVGWFATIPMTVGLALVGLCGWVIAGRLLPAHPASRGRADRGGRVRTTSDDPPTPRDGPPRWTAAIAIGGVLLVAGSWITRTVESVEHGMNTVDTFWYHLPAAARFVQTGHTTSIQYFDRDPTTAFYPLTASVLHGVGFLMFRTDLVSTVVNLGWLVLAFAAAWSLGRSFGVAPATTIGLSIVLGTPGLVGTQPGGAYDDVAGVALLVTALAIVVRDRAGPRTAAQDVVAGLAAGLAVGMKFIFVIPAAALCLGLVVTATRGHRLRRAATLFGCATVTGGYWYVRNAAATGNPLPSLSFAVGPFALHAPKAITPTSTVGRFLFDGRAWTDNFIPGLRSSLGPAWIAIVLLCLVGIAIGVFQSAEPRVRLIGLFALVSFATFVFTPQNLVGGFGRPTLFGAQVRLDATALAVGLILVPIVLRRWSQTLTVVFAAVLVLTQVDPSSWPTGFRWAAFAGRPSVHDAAWSVALLGLAVALIWACGALYNRASERAARTVTAVVCALSVLLGLAVVHSTYLDHRYTDVAPIPRIYGWARSVHHARIAVTGFYMQGQYPLAGLDLSDYEQYAGVRTEHGGYRDFESCQEWARFLRTGRYGYVVIGPTANLAVWTAMQPGARVELSEPIDRAGKARVTIYRLRSGSGGRSC